MNHTAIRAQYSTPIPKLINFVKMSIYGAAYDAQRRVTPVLCVTSDIYAYLLETIDGGHQLNIMFGFLIVLMLYRKTCNMSKVL